VYFDLVYPDFARLEHVTQVEVIFAAGAAGAWTLDGFRLDPSDAAPGATAELSTTTMHQCHHSYDWGGIRGVIDGRCILALRATDCGAALYQPRHVWEKGLEELIPDVDEVYSYHPVDGTKDVSTVYGIEKYARLMGAVGEGWDVGMPADWNSIYKDGDGTVLDIGRAFDVVENQDYGGVQCGFSGWLWQGVAGLCYTPHGYLCVEAGGHGLSNKASACCGTIYRKAPAGAWGVYLDNVATDEHYYWSSGADVVHHYDGTVAVEYEYRVNDEPNNTDFERLHERQWIWAWLYLGGATQPSISVDAAGRLWLARNDGVGNIQVYHRDSPQRDWEKHTDAFDDGEHEYPVIRPYTDGRIQVFATEKDGTSDVVESRDDARTWSVL